MTPPGGEGASRLPAEFRTLGTLLAVDIAFGAWLALNTGGGLSAFVGTQLPAVGIGGLLWGLLPDDAKKRFGEWLVRLLRRSALRYAALILLGAGFVVSLFYGSVLIESVDPAASTMVYLVRGGMRLPGATTITVRDSTRLNRLTTPLHDRLFITPVIGSRVWVYTPTHVSAGLHVYPWIGATARYPDDFDSLAILALLPSEKTADKLPVTLQVWLEDSTLVASDTLANSSNLLAFTRRQPDPADTARWRDTLTAISHDTGYVNPMMQTWKTSRWLRARVPLRQGDLLTWEARSRRGALLKRDTVRLHASVQDLVLRF